MTRHAKPSAGNEGIQANTVTADVLAVGRGATAQKIVLGQSDQRELLEALAALRVAVEALHLRPAVTQAIGDDVSTLERQSKQGTEPERASSLMAGVISKLKAAGVVISDVATLVEPIGKIAGLLRIAITGF